MSNLRCCKQSSIAIFAVLTFISSTPNRARADILSDNLSNTSAGTLSATSGSWFATSFGTGASAYKLIDVSLLLAETSPGTAELDIYTDGGLQPGTFVGALTSPSSYSSALAETTFTAHGVTLSANSTYWAVLRAGSGQFDWSWTADNTGKGIGFQDTWGESDDAGTTWFTDNTYPVQARVTADAVPETGTLAGFLVGGSMLGAFLLRRRQAGVPARS